MSDEIISVSPQVDIFFREIPFLLDWDFWSALAAALSSIFSIFVFVSVQRFERSLNQPRYRILTLDLKPNTSVDLKLENVGKFDMENFSISLRVYDHNWKLVLVNDQFLEENIAPNEIKHCIIQTQSLNMDLSKRYYFKWTLEWESVINKKRQPKFIKRVLDPDMYKINSIGLRAVRKGEWMEQDPESANRDT